MACPALASDIRQAELVVGSGLADPVKTPVGPGHGIVRPGDDKITLNELLTQGHGY